MFNMLCIMLVRCGFLQIVPNPEVFCSWLDCYIFHIHFYILTFVFINYPGWLLTIYGVRIHQVPFSRSSLNHNDVFILDTASKIFLFSGCNSSIQERAKALEVVQYIKETKHSGNCQVATIGSHLPPLLPLQSSFLYGKRYLQLLIFQLLQRMGNLLVILMWVNSGVYLVVMLLFPGTHLLLLKINLILHPWNYSGELQTNIRRLIYTSSKLQNVYLGKLTFHIIHTSTTYLLCPSIYSNRLLMHSHYLGSVLIHIILAEEKRKFYTLVRKRIYGL